MTNQFRTRLLRGVLGAIVATLAFASASFAAKTCYDCHQEAKKSYGSRRVIHQPVKEQNCESCHKRHGFSQQLILKDNSSELCYSCHAELKEPFSVGQKHFPVEKGVCWDCHDPHASDKRFLLRTGIEGADDPLSCLICHQTDLKESLTAEHKHPPFTDLDCGRCHSAHNSPHDGLLRTAANDLCAECHKATDRALQAAHKDKNTESLQCSACHSGHSSANAALLSDNTHAPFASGDCTTCHSLPDTVGQVAFEEGTTPAAVCTNCHDEQARGAEKPYPHAAVATDNCVDCHDPHSSRHESLLKKAEIELCADCHTDIVGGQGKAPHLPALAGECSKCHEVHGSENKALVRRDGSALCLECHTDFVARKDSALTVHAALDDCLTCHDPHEGVAAPVLKTKPGDLCVNCHGVDQTALMARSGHQPYLTSNCVECHQPHFSDKAHLVRDGGQALCLKCHADIGTRTAMEFPHPPATEDCLTCHKPHYSEQLHLLSTHEEELCASCHDYDELQINQNFAHTPAQEGDCTGCHNPHGATRENLLTGRITKVNIDGRMVGRVPHLTDKSSDLCYTCHDDLAEKFRRQGVHKPVEEGKCDACHAPHGSSHFAFVKDSASALCGSCHTLNDSLAAAHDNYDLSSADCLDCHNPHISEKPKLLRAGNHPPYETKDCEGCHTQGSDGKIQLAADVSELCQVCHDGVTADMSKKHQHAAFAGGDCLTCHAAHASDRQKLLRAEDNQLCFGCHGDLKDLRRLSSQHEPFHAGKCLDCHEPHASDNAGLINKPKETFCLSCHDDVKKELNAGPAHKPLLTGECGACHLPHAGKNEALLVSNKEELCGKCHDLKSTKITQAHSGFDVSDADCQSCHAPHAGTKNVPGLLLPQAHQPFSAKECSSCHQGTVATKLNKSPKQLCLDCHNDFAPQMARAVVHEPVRSDDGCTGCHSPHVGFGKSLQIKDGYKTCLTCHNGSEFTGKVRHQIAFEDCGNCHQPHSADYKGLLDTEDIMALCSTCHPDTKKTHYHPMGEGVTDPRTKDVLDCVSCHSPHSSEYSSILIADKDRKLCIVCHGVSMH